MTGESASVTDTSLCSPRLALVTTYPCCLRPVALKMSAKGAMLPLPQMALGVRTAGDVPEHLDRASGTILSHVGRKHLEDADDPISAQPAQLSEQKIAKRGAVRHAYRDLSSHAAPGSPGFLALAKGEARSVHPPKLPPARMRVNY